MNRRDLINYYLLNIALLWDFADFYLGEVVVSFLALPIVLLGRIIYAFSIDIFYLTAIVFVCATFLVTFIGLRVIPLERYTKLLLPKILGFMIALFWTQTRIFNFLLLGFTYNVLYKSFFRYFLAKDLINNYLREFLGLNFFWEKFLFLFAVATTSGVATNIIYNFLKLFSVVL